MIGRVAYDNWLVNHVYHSAHTTLIDATSTILIIHQTDQDGIWAGGGRMVKNEDDYNYNKPLARGEIDHGSTGHAQFETQWEDGNVVLVNRQTLERKNVVPSNRQTHELLKATSTVDNQENLSSTKIKSPDQSLLVLMSVRIGDEAQIVREIQWIHED